MFIKSVTMNYKLLLQKKDTIPYFFLILLSFFPILTINGISKILVCFFVSTLIFKYNTIISKIKNIGIKPLIINSSFYFILIISLLYSPEKEKGYSIIIREISFLLAPLMLIYGLNLNKKIIKIITSVFIISNILVLVYLSLKINLVDEIISNPFGVFNKPFFLEINRIDYKDWHSTYIGLNNLISVLILLNYLFKSTNFKRKIIAVLIIAVFIIFFIILNSRTMFLITLFMIPLFVILKLRLLKHKIVVILITITSVIVLTGVSKGNKLGRIFVKPVEYYVTNFSMKEVLGVRYQIHECSKELIAKKPLLGYGLGYVPDILSNYCYEVRNFKTKLLSKYNSHSTYYFLLLSSGIVALITFLFLIINNLRISILNKDYLYFTILLVFIFAFFTENYFVRLNGIVLFSFCNALFYKKNIDKLSKKIIN